jgi:hypothetical protein
MLADICRRFWGGPIPELAQAIYATVAGTPRNIATQELMDFVPGYRLIHVDELQVAHDVVQQRSGRNDLFPILADYAASFICTGASSVFDLDDLGDLIEMHKSGLLFLRTIAECYESGVYFLDQDGYLDYDARAEQLVGFRLNPGLAYWEA